MDGERKINLSEVTENVALNATVKTSELSFHINMISKQVKLMLILNFLLSILCMVLSGAAVFYYWNEMICMRRQIDTMKDQLLFQNLRSFHEEKAQQSALVSPPQIHVIERNPMDIERPTSDSQRSVFHEDKNNNVLTQEPIPKSSKKQTIDSPTSTKELSVTHFNGYNWEHNLKLDSTIGPWVRDTDVSSKSREENVEVINSNMFTVKDSGLYLIYAQVVYLTHAPNCYFIWSRPTTRADTRPRLLTACSTGDDSTERPIDKSQISCSVQTVTRLNEGDTVNIAQREQNRTVLMSPGYSYIGFVKLSS